jgi:hypothetical protein
MIIHVNFNINDFDQLSLIKRPLFSSPAIDLHRHSAETAAVSFSYRPNNGVHYTNTPITYAGIRIV